MHTNFISGLILSRLLYAYKSNKGYINIPRSRYALLILDIFMRKGFIQSYKVISSKIIVVYLVYYEGRALFTGFKMISKPSKRVYMSYINIRSKLLKRRLVVISTDKGLLTSMECIAFKKGGEVLFELV